MNGGVTKGLNGGLNGDAKEATMKKTAEDAAPRPSVSVVVPALNEADTVAAVIDSVRPSLDAGIVDEIIVVDSDSTDATAEIAAAAGARVVNWRDVLPDVEPRRGKGEALWRGVAAARGDVVVFLDADVRDPSPAVVPTLIAPLLSDESVRLVKGHYRRDHPTDVLSLIHI